MEFQDGSFLDVESIEGFTIAKTDEPVPNGMLILDICIGDRHWYQIKKLSVNGRTAVIISFERMSYKFETVEETVKGDSPYHYAKVVAKYELTEEEIIEIFSRRMMEFTETEKAQTDEGRDGKGVHIET